MNKQTTYKKMIGIVIQHFPKRRLWIIPCLHHLITLFADICPGEAPRRRSIVPNLIIQDHTKSFGHFSPQTKQRWRLKVNPIARQTFIQMLTMYYFSFYKADFSKLTSRRIDSSYCVNWNEDFFRTFSSAMLVWHISNLKMFP